MNPQIKIFWLTNQEVEIHKCHLNEEIRNPNEKIKKHK